MSPAFRHRAAVAVMALALAGWGGGDLRAEDAAPPSPAKASAVGGADKIRLRQHVERFWRVPPEARDAKDLTIYVRVTAQSDGTVTGARAQTLDQVRAKNPHYDVIANSALRAVVSASPLPIPADKYEQFKDFTLALNPKFAAGR